jgi:subtilisin family serine protease
MARGNKPWDYDGHGTIVSGIIAATQNNDVGIAGIDPNAKLMVLKSLNAFGNTRASFIAEAIVYATDNGARIINISVGGPSLSRVERAAVEYANKKGVLIVAAAGNEGQDLEDYGPSGLPGVLTVSATDLEDGRTVFSNWGEQVDIAAPGIDVLSLRARRTDTMRDIPEVQYIAAANYVGEDKRYYRSSGTSFAAPIVTGVASLMLSKEPDLSNEELRRMLTQSAEDADIPGKDQYTGYGIVNAKAALTIDRDFFVDAAITGASVVQADGGAALLVQGTANANRFQRAWIEIGAGDEPTQWKQVGKEIKEAVSEGELAVIPAQEFAGATTWILRLISEDKDGEKREAWFKLTLG